MDTLESTGEFEAIRRLIAARRRAVLRAAAGAAEDPNRPRMRGGDVLIAAGDDAAVMRPEAGRDLVITADAFIEGRHYDPRWCSPATAGRRLALANLSDLAAMGAAPRWALHTLAAPRGREMRTLEAFEEGLAEALAEHGTTIVGGNLSACDGAPWSSLTLVGEVHAGRAWHRGGARAGDALAVTGLPGRAGAAWRLAQAGEITPATGALGVFAPLVSAWIEPVSRVPFAVALAALGGVTAAIDLSDGLAGDLGHLSNASGVGAVIEERALPADAPLANAARTLGVSEAELRFGASDDYELLIAMTPDTRARAETLAATFEVPFEVIGRLAGEAGVLVLETNDGARTPLPGKGFDHFG